MKKKILFTINTMGQAGAEKAMIELMKVLDPSLYEIDLYVMIPRGEMFTGQGRCTENPRRGSLCTGEEIRERTGEREKSF